jgi:DNA-binding CsgD family transcriptional regulator
LPLEIGASVALLDEDPTAPFWLPRAVESQGLAATARALCDDATDPLTREVVESAWRSVHRSPAFRPDAWSAVSYGDVPLSQVGDRDLDIASRVDRIMWDAVDALEVGHRFDYDRLVREARALCALGTMDHLHWWVQSAAVTRAMHDGQVTIAMEHADSAAVFARGRGILGGPSVLAIQRWCLDELRGDHAFGVEVGLTQGRRVDHPLSAVCPALSMARSGLVPLAVPWADWATDYLNREDQESSWLAVISICADLASMLVEAEHPAGESLARAVSPSLERFRHRVAIDTRAVLSLGPVARAAADLAITRGALDDAAAYVEDAETVLQRMGRPPIPEAELAVSRARLALARRQDPTHWVESAMGIAAGLGLGRLLDEARDIATELDLRNSPAVLTDRERQVLRLVGEGMSNPQIATAVAYSRATIAKDLRRLYAKLGASDREQLMGLADDMGLLDP